MNKNFQLKNQVNIPSIGFGTWQITEPETAINAVKNAIETGYRHIDTAAIYENEQAVGAGIKESGIAREELFVTTKVWNSHRGYENTLQAFEKSLQDLQLNYLDLYLIHWPAAAHQFDNWKEINESTWSALEKLYAQGKVRAIGVSNFLNHHLEPLLENASITPMVNQIEYHPGYMQNDTVKFCRENHIQVEGWSPLGRGKVLENEVLTKIASKYNKSVAQLCIRWALQNDILPLPKSATPHRIKENFDVFDFEISDVDMTSINQMGTFGESGLHPDSVAF